MGICNDFMALPFRQFGEEDRRKIEKFTEELKGIIN